MSRLLCLIVSTVVLSLGLYNSAEASELKAAESKTDGIGCYDW